MPKLLLWRDVLRGTYLKCLRGTTAIEYSLIAGGIAVAISVIVFSVGSDLKGLFQAIAKVASKF